MHPQSKTNSWTQPTDARQHRLNLLKLGSTLSLCLLLSHCANSPTSAPSPVEVRDVSVQTGQAQSQQDTATPYQDQNNYNVERAEYYEQLANSQNDQTSQTDATLSAAEFYVQANDYQQAQQTIAQLDLIGMSEQHSNRYHIVLAYIDYSTGNYQEALQKLDGLLEITNPEPFSGDGSFTTNADGSLESNADGSFETSALEEDETELENKTQRVDALLLSSFCYQQLNDFEAAIAALIQREQLLVGGARAETSRYTWQLINGLTEQDRQNIIGQTDNTILRNRLEQSLDGQFANQTELPSQFDQWREPSFTDKQIFSTDWNASSPKRIAVLLPLTSRFSTAAHAVMDGIEYQHANNISNFKPEVDFYDIGDDPNQAMRFYSSIKQMAYDLVIGPIGKDYANQLVVSANTYSANTQTFDNVPTILLGGDTNLTQQANSNFSRLTFSPEADGIEVANHAKRLGHVTAALLVPNDDSGQRTASAFQRRWLNQGGNISKLISYSPNQFDHSVELKQLFEINQSEYRHRRLSDVLGSTPEFSAYRRSDVDFIFMIADNESGRILRPQINFFRSDTVPVYSSSGIFNGIQDSTNNLDLEQTHFPVIPWVLQSIDVAPYAGQLNLLFAMGSDAYQVAANYRSMLNNPELAISGKMGSLHFERSGEIVFQPVWAEFKNGLAEANAALPELQNGGDGQLGGPQSSLDRANNYNDSNWDTGQSSRKTGVSIPQ